MIVTDHWRWWQIKVTHLLLFNNIIFTKTLMSLSSNNLQTIIYITPLLWPSVTMDQQQTSQSPAAELWAAERDVLVVRHCMKAFVKPWTNKLTCCSCFLQSQAAEIWVMWAALLRNQNIFTSAVWAHKQAGNKTGKSLMEWDAVTLLHVSMCHITQPPLVIHLMEDQLQQTETPAGFLWVCCFYFDQTPDSRLRGCDLGWL